MLGPELWGRFFWDDKMLPLRISCRNPRTRFHEDGENCRISRFFGTFSFMYVTPGVFAVHVRFLTYVLWFQIPPPSPDKNITTGSSVRAQVSFHFFIQKKTVRHNSCAPELGCCSKKTHPNLGEIGLELSRLEFYKFWGRKKIRSLTKKVWRQRPIHSQQFCPWKIGQSTKNFQGVSTHCF